jgi:2-polyprenyl-3-methyl-5-hydroxy-6-metoxy-1,4-benzoquinol methylase
MLERNVPHEEARFAFGENWQRFLATVDEDRVGKATSDLASMLDRSDLSGTRFLDVGSGSGLSSLAARQLGAQVHSFDVDPECVECTVELRRRYDTGDGWTVEPGSVLDRRYLDKLGSFDIVYSWGVLHHTGAMWDAMEAVGGLVAPGGVLFIALYNDQGRRSRVWGFLKRLYVTGPTALRPLLLMIPFAVFHMPRFAVDTLHGAPLRSWRGYWRTRGMSAWHDIVDWAGGYPFEVARPGEVHDFYRRRGFTLERLVTTTGSGCNEFVFRRNASSRS